MDRMDQSSRNQTSGGVGGPVAWGDVIGTLGDQADLLGALNAKAPAAHTHGAFSSMDAGFVPASGGGTTNFLRADGSWAAPAGGGGGSALPWNAVVVTVDLRGSYQHEQTIADASIVAGDVIDIRLDDCDVDDENEPDMLDLILMRAKAGTGTVEIVLTFLQRTSGPVKLLWRKSS